MINPFKYIKKTLKIMPITEKPKSQMSKIYIPFSIMAFLKASKLFILLLFILSIKVLILLIINSLSPSFKTIRKIEPEIIPKITTNNTNKFVFLPGNKILNILLNLFFIYYHHLSILKIN